MIFPPFGDENRKPPINIGGFCIEMIAFKKSRVAFQAVERTCDGRV